MSSTYKSFALVGATGMIGRYLVAAFTAKGISVVAITRSASGKPQVPASVKVEEVPGYDDVEAVTTILKKHEVDVLICAIARQGLHQQFQLADAAKNAGVKLFVPSEFAVASPDPKEQYVDHCKSIGLPTLQISTGVFTSLLPFLVSHHLNGKFNIIGDGNKKVSFTEETDIAEFVIHALTTFAPDKLSYKHFRLEGDRATFAEIASWYNKSVIDLSVSEIATQVPDFLKELLQLADEGVLTSLYDGQSGKEVVRNDNAEWVGHEWKTVKAVCKF